jgi:hypothetical protein
MKSAYLLLIAGFATIGLFAEGCVSGDSVNGSGGQNGSSGGGRTGTGNSSGSVGGSSFGTGGSSFGQGGFTGGSQGGFTGGSQGGFTGGSQGGFTGGGAGGTTITGPCSVATADALIDDFEKAANGVAHPCVHGYWYTYNDGSAGTQTPAVNMWMNVAITDRAGSTMAGHSTAMGFTGDVNKNIFAGFGLDFNPAPAPSTAKFTVNASAFKGISFFAKGSGTINVEIPTPNTDPALGCVVTTTNPCYNVSTKIITLTSTWTQFNLMWGDFATLYGAKETLTGNGIGGVKFEGKPMAPATTFPPYDMWIDDLKFIP